MSPEEIGFITLALCWIGPQEETNAGMHAVSQVASSFGPDRKEVPSKALMLDPQSKQVTHHSPANGCVFGAVDYPPKYLFCLLP